MTIKKPTQKQIEEYVSKSCTYLDNTKQKIAENDPEFHEFISQKYHLRTSKMYNDLEDGTLFMRLKNSFKIVNGTISQKKTSNKKGYLKIRVSWNGQTFLMYKHRILYFLYHGNFPSNYIDHIDRNSLNNSKANLRTVSANFNQMNKNNFGSSRFRGVCRAKGKAKNRPWQAYANVIGKKKHLGYFETEEQAYDRYVTFVRDWNLPQKEFI